MSDYKINFDWVSDISLDGDKIVITGKRSKDWDAPEYIVKFKLEQWHLRLLVGIPSGLASKRAKEALDFKQKLAPMFRQIEKSKSPSIPLYQRGRPLSKHESIQTKNP